MERSEKFSVAMCDMLMDHLEKGPILNIKRFKGCEINRYHTLHALLNRGWIAFDRRDPAAKFTHITDDGRLALGRLLAAFADRLERAGFDVEDRGNAVNAGFARIFHNLHRTQAEHSGQESSF
jgi:hypothetical protein